MTPSHGRYMISILIVPAARLHSHSTGNVHIVYCLCISNRMLFSNCRQYPLREWSTDPNYYGSDDDCPTSMNHKYKSINFFCSIAAATVTNHTQTASYFNEVRDACCCIIFCMFRRNSVWRWPHSIRAIAIIAIDRAGWRDALFVFVVVLYVVDGQLNCI